MCEEKMVIDEPTVEGCFNKLGGLLCDEGYLAGDEKKREALLEEGAQAALSLWRKRQAKSKKARKEIHRKYPNKKHIRKGYGKEYFSEMASIRRTQLKKIKKPVGGKNVAIIKIAGQKEPSIFLSMPPQQGVKVCMHSELAAWNAYRAYLESGAKIEWLYTERQPCGKLPGHANCDALLQIMMEDHGVDGAETPVYYSFPYPDTSNGSKEEAKKICKETTEKIMEIDKNL